MEEREANGPYASVADLARVPGLGVRSVERLAPHLALPPGGPASRAARPRPARAGERGRSPPFARTGANTQPPGSTERAGAPGPPLDLNRATVQELQQLPGIGPALAGRIVALRTERGAFAAPEELKEVSGIGAKTYARLAPLVTARR